MQWSCGGGGKMFLMFALALLALAVPQEPAVPSVSPEVLAELKGLGVALHLEERRIEFLAKVCQDRDPLEFLIVNEHGKKHEALFRTENVSAQALNTAMLLCGAQQGENVSYIPVEPPPTKEEYEAGAPLSVMVPASGDGFYIYATWETLREDGDKETFLYRAEDLVVNVDRDRPYHRGQFIYLGSRFIKPHKDAAEMFAADAIGNYVALIYRKPANHLLGGNDLDATNQYAWYPNMFLLPEIGATVKIILSRKKLVNVYNQYQF
jgi:hypothetical protein